MPGLKFVIRKDVMNSDGKTNLKLRITHKRKVAHLKTPWYIRPGDLDDHGWIRSSVRGHTTRNGAMIKMMDEYNDVIAEIGTEIRNMSIETLCARLRAHTEDGVDFVKYIEERIKALRKEKKYGTAELYTYTLKHLKDYSEKDKLLFQEITVPFLDGFEKYLKAAGCGVNTRRNYLCNIRQIFNHAIDKTEVIKQQLYPFRKYKIKGEKKKARALEVKDLRRLLQAQPYFSRAEQRDLDMFFLIFYTGGTNFKDLIFLKRRDYYNDRLIYRRFKTGREYSIKVYPEAREIIERYQGEEYLLKFIEHKIDITPAAREDYINKDMLKNTNKNLRKVGEGCGLPFYLSTYVARYSFATIASKADVSKDIIAQILGHGLNTDTDLYIDFDQEKADKAIRKVIDELKDKPPRPAATPPEGGEIPDKR